MTLRRYWSALAGILWIPALLFAPVATAQDAALRVTIHVVQRGENLYRIALDYGTTITELARLNSLTNPDSIEVGQRLLVPAFEGDPSAALTHIVQPNETLDSIAALYGAVANDLQTLNGLADASIFVGQTLAIGAVAPPIVSPDVPAIEAEAGSPPASVIHTVRSGETLFRIAQAYGVDVAAIVEANSLANADLIDAGQMLLVPGVEPPQLLSEMPLPVTGFDVTPVVFIEGQSGRFRVVASEPITVAGTFLNQTLMAVYEANNTVATLFVGIPVATGAGVYPVALTVTSASSTASLTANVQVGYGGYYQERDIQLIGDSNVLLDPNVEQNELSILSAYMTPITPERYFIGTFGLPAAATVTSAFGNVRSYNEGAVLRTHYGVDFGGAPGTPILAPAAGRVVLADMLTVRGLATILDHGWGVYTGYWHQSEAYVQPGQAVQAGQIIGLVGATGRVSGPHLHWEMWVGGVPVDPLQWTVQTFD